MLYDVFKKTCSTAIERLNKVSSRTCLTFEADICLVLSRDIRENKRKKKTKVAMISLGFLSV
jgi:hypothetical protein